MLDFETTSSNSIIIRTTDQDGLSYDETFTVSITNTNDAPVLTPYSPTLPLSENGSPYVATIASLLGSSVADADSSPAEGIAIFSVNLNGGTLEYSTDGSTWNTVPAVSATGALLLRETDRMRFTPSTANGGTSFIAYRAWDQTSGASGGFANITAHGGTTAFSTATDTITVNVSSVNDAPTVTNGASYTLTSTNEDTVSSGTLASTILTNAGYADVDTGAISGMAITGTTGSGTWQYSTNGSSWQNFGLVSNTNALLITSATLVRYIPDTVNGETATFTYRAWDRTTGTASTNTTASYTSTATNGGSTAFSSDTAAASLVVTSVNDVPVITGLDGDYRTFSEGNAPTLIGSATGITDVDSNDFASGTLTISFVAGSDSAEDILAVRNEGGGVGQIGVSGSNITYGGVLIGTFTGGSNGTPLTVTLNASANTTSITALINNLTYLNSDTDNPTVGDRTISVVLTDGDGGTSVINRTTMSVAGVNDAPVNSLPGYRQLESILL